MTRRDIDRFSPAEMDALNEIARMKLYYTEEVEIRAEILNRLAEGLRQIYPGLSMVKIRNKIKRTYWEITLMATPMIMRILSGMFMVMEQFTGC